MKNSIFARFARAYFIFWHFADVLVLSTTWNDPFCSCVDDVSIWWQMFNFVLLCPKRWFQLNSRIVRTRFSSIMTLNNWKRIAVRRSYIFRWRSGFRRRRVCLSSLISLRWNARAKRTKLLLFFTSNMQIYDVLVTFLAVAWTLLRCPGCEQIWSHVVHVSKWCLKFNFLSKFSTC